MREAALAQWHDFLRPGGKVITTARVRYGVGPAPIGFLPDEIQTFHDRALSLAEAMKETLDLPPETLAEAAREYASNKVTLPFSSTDEIRDYFTAAGFSPVKLTTGGVSSKADRPSGPSTGWKTERVQIIAQKP